MFKPLYTISQQSHKSAPTIIPYMFLKAIIYCYNKPAMKYTQLKDRQQEKLVGQIA